MSAYRASQPSSGQWAGDRVDDAGEQVNEWQLVMGEIGAGNDSNVSGQGRSACRYTCPPLSGTTKRLRAGRPERDHRAASRLAAIEPPRR